MLMRYEALIFMKNSIKILTVVLPLLWSAQSNAQSNWELGGRFGEQVSIEATIPVGPSPRLHPAVYLDRVGVATYFDWLFALDGAPNGLKFYPGFGPEVYLEGRFDLNVAGDFGVEYSFDFPLSIGFDWRPGFRLTNDVDFNSNNWGFIARFRFGEGTSFRRVN